MFFNRLAAIRIPHIFPCYPVGGTLAEKQTTFVRGVMLYGGSFNDMPSI
jgi:hypothetical protein